jgi:hypothetical protein
VHMSVFDCGKNSSLVLNEILYNHRVLRVNGDC